MANVDGSARRWFESHNKWATGYRANASFITPHPDGATSDWDLADTSSFQPGQMVT